MIGAIVAGADSRLDVLVEMARELAIAFQIRDDVLNFGAAGPYGKETHGDLWEGKRTLIVLHMIRTLPERDRIAACEILARPRPDSPAADWTAMLAALEAAGDLTPRGREQLEATRATQPAKTADDVERVAGWISACGSVEHARAIGNAHALRAREALNRAELRPSAHHELLHALVDFTTTREH
jgi:geranylgeranyl diphosphate synthase type II